MFLRTFLPRASPVTGQAHPARGLGAWAGLQTKSGANYFSRKHRNLIRALILRPNAKRYGPWMRRSYGRLSGGDG